jgi:hypothetical protein
MLLRLRPEETGVRSREAIDGVSVGRRRDGRIHRGPDAVVDLLVGPETPDDEERRQHDRQEFLALRGLDLLDVHVQAERAHANLLRQVLIATTLYIANLRSSSNCVRAVPPRHVALPRRSSGMPETGRSSRSASSPAAGRVCDSASRRGTSTSC